MELKKKDSLRKKLKAVENTMRRRQDPEDAERNRNKEREKKRKQCLERKKAKEAVFTETNHSSEEEGEKP